MGRRAWTLKEFAYLARAWIYASENPIRDIDQTTNRFCHGLFEQFGQLEPRGYNTEQYCGREVKPIKAKIENVSADC